MHLRSLLFPWFGLTVLLGMGPQLLAQLEDVTVDFPMQSSTFGSLFGCGLSTVDYNGDGWDDVTVAGADGIVKLYAGSESGFALDLQLDLLQEAKAVLWVDIENDGDLDLFAGVSGLGVYLYVQQPDGTLIEEGTERGVPFYPGWNNRGISARDYDRDGDLDIYLTSYHDPWEALPQQNKLLQNSGNGYFEDVTLMTFVGDGFKQSFQGAWFDYDSNGFDDLWVINDREDYLNSLYLNSGGEMFVDASESSGANIAVSAMSATLFDPDNDGDWDQYVTDIEDSPNAFLVNNNSYFEDHAESAGIGGMRFAWGACAIDIDGDRWDDLMVATYRFPIALPYDNYLYMNQGTGLSFEDATDDWPNEQFELYCIGRLDLNQDRTPDVIGHGNAQSPQVLMLTNEGDNARLTVDLVGTVSNTRGVGSVIKVHADGVVQMKQVNAGEDFMTQHNYTRFFGMGDVEVIDSVEVFWPTGDREVLFDVVSNSALLVVEGAGSGAMEPLHIPCPWGVSSWSVPFDPATTTMTWNGAPVFQDVVVADAPGEWTLEAVWPGTGHTWSQTVTHAPEETPALDLHVVPPSCFGEPGLVSWDMPDSSTVTIDGVVLPNLTDGYPLEVGQIEWQVELSVGCTLDTMIAVVQPDALFAEVDLVQPACAGDLGEASIVTGGGMGTLTLETDGFDLSALMPGVVHFSVADTAGCLYMDSLVVEAPDSLVGSVAFQYLGVSDSVLVEYGAAGGTPPYSWNWNGPIDENGQALAPLGLGWYVLDLNGCLDLGALEIGANPALSVAGENADFAWSCERLDGKLYLQGPDGEQLQLTVYDRSGRLVLNGVKVSAGSVLELWSTAPVVVTGLSAEGQLFRWLK